MNQYSSNPPAAERKHIADDSKSSTGEIQVDKCLNQLFEEQASRSPDVVAVAFEEQQLSYGELNRRSNQLAHYLGELGVGPEVLVAVCVEPSLEMIVALMAVLKAGGAYVPLDPAYPVDRLRFMLADSAPLALLTQGSLLGLFHETGQDLKVVDLSAAKPPWSSHPETNPDARSKGLHAGSLAQVIYTSGSTGKPKGVLIEHRYYVILARWLVSERIYKREYSSLLVTSFSYGAFYKNLFIPLFLGGQVHLLRTVKDPALVLSTVTGANVRLLNLTPTAFSMLVDADSRGVLAKIETVILVGEQIQLQKLSVLSKTRPQILNTYSQTEIGMASMHRIEPEFDLSKQQSSFVGCPLPYVRIYILNDEGEPVAKGAEGELHIASAALARGYLNRPKLTEERFLADRFAAESGARMFKTGDRGRWLPDGTLEFLGRNDHQVQIRGIRVELGEIEARLMEHAAVREAVVVAREDRPGDKRLIAYYVAQAKAGGAEDTLRPDELRRHVAESLPEHMIPAAYVRLETLPLTPTRKLDRMALPPPEREHLATSGSHVAPRDRLEEMLASIWGEVLGADRIGIYDDFFELGGDSLQAARVVGRVIAALPEYNVSLRTMLRTRTVEQFARALIEGSEDSSCLVALREGNQKPPVYFVPGLGGTALSVQDMAMALPQDQPFYCLEPRGLDGRSTPSATVEEAAEYNIGLIRKAQPQGPYHLGGYSYGGLVAFEMACRLRSLGEDVGVVALIDMANLTYDRVFLSRFERTRMQSHFLLRRVLHHARRLARMNLREWRSYVAGRAKNLHSRLGAGFLTPIKEEDSAGVLEPVWNATISAMRTYTPKPYEGQLLVFRASRPREDPCMEETLGWGPLAKGGVTVIEIDGDHFLMLSRPQVKAIGERLNRALLNTRETGGAGAQKSRAMPALRNS